MEIEMILIIALFILVLILVVLLLRSESRIIHQMDARMDNFEHNTAQNITTQINGSSSLLIAAVNQSTLTQQNSLEQINKSIHDSAVFEETKLENFRTTMSNSLQLLNTENNKRLDEIRKTVDEKLQDTLNKRLSESFKNVADQLQMVQKGLGEMQTLANGVGDLKKVLSNVKTRGILGEIQLGAILKDILSPQQYEENIATIPGSSNRVEFAVRLPGNDGGYVYLPIDSKFPLDCYSELQRAVENADVNHIAECKKLLVTRLKSEAKDIHDKYIQIPYTTEFGILFLPTEGLYSTCCELGMQEILQKDYRITISGPSNMAALLNSLQMGFQTLAIQQRSSEVWNLLASVKAEFGTFEKVLQTAQNRIQQTSEELDKLVGTRTRAINRQLRSVSENGIPLTQIQYDITKEDE